MITRAFGRGPLYDARLVWAAVLAACVATVACDRAALLAPINSRISLTVSNRVLPLGGSAVLTATVLENSGSPVPNGTTVRFLTSLGRVEPAEATTSNGAATATFFAGDISGTADVQAISGLATPSGGTGGTTTPGTGGTPTPAPSTSVANTVQILVGSAAAGRMTLTANPSTVRSSGSSVEIQAFVTATNGQSLPNVPVAFSTTRGTINPLFANTDAGGVARTTLTASEAATVTARVGTGTGGSSSPTTPAPGQTPTTPSGDALTATITVSASTVASFTLAVAPTSPAVGQPISLTITPAGTGTTTPSTPTSSRVVVNWGDNSNPQDIGVVSAVRSVTHTYALPGFYTIEATGTSPDGETFTNAIPVSVAQQPGVAISAQPTSGNIGTSFTFTITPTTGALIESITVDYGDNTSENLGPVATQTTRQHQYSTVGPKTVTVTQREVAGRVTTATVTVSVTN